MPLDRFNNLELPAAADLHVHLRDGPMMKLVVPTIRKGGVDTVFVMPNLVPPITTVSAALEYKQRLQQLDHSVNYLMSLYLHPDVTPATIIEAKKAGITGVKSYPAGVTTNSASGVVDYEAFYPVFAEMERQDMVLNLHGEAPSVPGSDVTVLNAEERFLPTLLVLHQRFPDLRIILEHCTTAKAVSMVSQCGPTVAATITAHHLHLTVDDVVGDSFNFCKPVAKTPGDRSALLQAAISGNPKFFFGTDSAPHPAVAKRGGSTGQSKAAAGIFTQPFAVPLVLDALEKAIVKGEIKEDDVTEANLRGFLSDFGRAFYKVPEGGRIMLQRGEAKIADVFADGELEVVPFRRGEATWGIKWIH
ncbi:dihydroorotase [Trichodelitschia bisporula]|uniref:dihydroorotase n=1 Tax=Trichodelitschia bisporula TaxID=703511 RepID=A0A6G1I700_9PEZI|nr:dihydroorotase [Trichodelitschia bisporula]